jgi:hypothetical protein
MLADNIDNSDRVNLYNDIMKSLEVDEKNKKIFIKLNFGEKVTIDLMEMGYSMVVWNEITPKFDDLLKNTVILNEYDEFLAFQKLCIDNKITSKKRIF